MTSRRARTGARLVMAALLAVLVAAVPTESSHGSERTRTDHASVVVGRQTWVWSFHKPSSLVARAKRAKIDSLLVWVGPGFAADRRTVARLRRLGKLSGRAGISMSALCGDPSWAVKPRVAGAWAVEVERSHLFRRIHLDVEPQGLFGSAAERRAATKGLLDSIRKVRSAGLPVDVDIPYWYHRLRTASGVPLDVAVMRLAGSVTLMSYQNTAHKVLRVSGPEMADADRLGVPARIGLNLAPATKDAPTSTMYGSTPRTIRAAVRLVVHRAKSRWSSFAGIAIHDSTYLDVIAH